MAYVEINQKVNSLSFAKIVGREGPGHEKFAKTGPYIEIYCPLHFLLENTEVLHKEAKPSHNL